MISPGWTGLEDGAADELERAQVSPASGIGHLRVVGGAAGELKGAGVCSECNPVTRAADTTVGRVRMMLERALQDWRDHASATDLRRCLHRLLIELDA